MKRLVIIEGQNDGVFIKHIMKNSNNGNIKYWYYQNQGNKKKKKYNETNILRDFLNDRSSLEFLIKEEGGKSFVKNFFLRNVLNFTQRFQKLELTVIFDHDGNKPDKEIDNWRKDFASGNTSNVSFESVGTPKKIANGLCLRKFDLYQIRGKNKVNLNCFHLVTFDKSLESEVAEFCKKGKKQITDQDIQKFASQVPLENLFP